MISRTNYEIWFIDFLEGKLGEAAEIQLYHFLEENPDLAAELEGIKEVMLDVPKAIPYPQKSNLLKQSLDDAAYFENACIDFIEGNGTPVNNALLLEYSRSHPEKEKELIQFKQTVLIADENLVYPNKSKLFKKAPLVAFYTFTRYVAALLFVGLLLAGYLNYRAFNAMGPTYVAHQGPFKMQENKPSATKTDKQISNIKTMKLMGEERDNASLTTAKRTPIIASGEVLKREDIETQSLLSPIKPRIKPTTLVFVPSPLTQVRTPNIAEEKKGLLAGIFKGRETESDVSKAAKSIGNAKVAPSVLNLLSDISEERITYSENNAGNISSIRYKSKLLSFSVPVKQNRE